MSLKIEYLCNDLVFEDKSINGDRMEVILFENKSLPCFVIDRDDAVDIVRHLNKEFNLGLSL